MQTATAIPIVESPIVEGAAPAVAGGTDRGLCIAVLERGFVFVGRAAVTEGWLRLVEASCVRRWGTTRGLGQLATEGPQPATKLDPAGEVQSPLGSVVALISCDASKWAH